MQAVDGVPVQAALDASHNHLVDVSSKVVLAVILLMFEAKEPAVWRVELGVPMLPAPTLSPKIPIP